MLNEALKKVIAGGVLTETESASGRKKPASFRKPVFCVFAYFRLPTSLTVMVFAKSAAEAVMSLETVTSPLNIAETSFA